MCDSQKWKPPDKCYQALMSHIFFSHFEWECTPDGKCCVDSGDTLLHKSLNKEQMPGDFLTHSATLTVLAQDFFQVFLFFLLWLAFHIFLNISCQELVTLQPCLALRLTWVNVLDQGSVKSVLVRFKILQVDPSLRGLMVRYLNFNLRSKKQHQMVM